MITIPLRILMVEDFKVDADLAKRQIEKIVENPQIEVVDNLNDFHRKLQNFVPDVIISDYNLPTCNGLDILELTRAVDANIPFIFLTGTIDDDELAANTILAGASGFVLKKHMKHLDEKLRPLLKKVVFNMIEKEELREKIRKNKIAVNQIYQYLDNINTDNEDQRNNINQIRKNIEEIEFNKEEEERDS